jgi:hypothetical protein
MVSRFEHVQPSVQQDWSTPGAARVTKLLEPGPFRLRQAFMHYVMTCTDVPPGSDGWSGPLVRSDRRRAAMGPASDWLGSPVRVRALREGKLLYMAVPKLADPLLRSRAAGVAPAGVLAASRALTDPRVWDAALGMPAERNAAHERMRGHDSVRGHDLVGVRDCAVVDPCH